MTSLRGLSNLSAPLQNMKKPMQASSRTCSADVSRVTRTPYELEFSDKMLLYTVVEAAGDPN